MLGAERELIAAIRHWQSSQKHWSFRAALACYTPKYPTFSRLEPVWGSKRFGPCRVQDKDHEALQPGRVSLLRAYNPEASFRVTVAFHPPFLAHLLAKVRASWALRAFINYDRQTVF